MKTKSLIFILLVVAGLIIIKVTLLKPDKNTQKGAPQKAQIAIVTGFVVHAEALENKIYSSGTVKANEEVMLHPEVQGKLTAITFQEGSIVNKGALLAKINDADLQAQFAKLELQLKLAKEKEQRLKGMLAINGVSQEEYDAALNQMQTINADKDYLKAQIAKTEIRAPFTGKIGLRQVSEGSFVNNSTLIASIQQSEILKLDFPVPEKYAAIVVVGDTVHFSVENLPGQFNAKVFAIEPRIDEQTRNIMVRAIYQNTMNNIYPGSFARIELIASKTQSALMIPTEAVIPELKGKKVFLCKSGKAIPVKVETGTRTDSKIEIVTGLTEGDTLIVTGIMSLKPEMQIKLVELKK